MVLIGSLFRLIATENMPFYNVTIIASRVQSELQHMHELDDMTMRLWIKFDNLCQLILSFEL